jgi:hypothetical protein
VEVVIVVLRGSVGCPVGCRVRCHDAKRVLRNG